MPFFRKKKPKKPRRSEPVQPSMENRVQPGKGSQSNNLYGMSGGQVAVVAVVGCGTICQIVASVPALLAASLGGALFYADKWITDSNETEREKWKTIDGMRVSGLVDNGSSNRRGQRAIGL